MNLKFLHAPVGNYLIYVFIVKFVFLRSFSYSYYFVTFTGITKLRSSQLALNKNPTNLLRLRMHVDVRVSKIIHLCECPLPLTVNL
jgi:hypothetical protein